MANTNIVVAVRSRPVLNGEIGCDPPLQEIGNTIIGTKEQFSFDYVFKKDSTNQEVYDTCVAKSIQTLFEGFNVTILAYGSTGSGKTHTMGTSYGVKGNSDISGVIPQGVKDIFSIIESQKDIKEFVVKVSFVEIYLNEMLDLSIPNGKLRDKKNQLTVREIRLNNNESVVEVKNLTQKVVHNVEEALSILTTGSSRRHVGKTDKNKDSSRSHAIFTVTIQQIDKLTLNGVSAKFQMVDLAGSERCGSSGTAGVQLAEGAGINTGLYCLALVLRSLSDPKKKDEYINYRSHKLTHLLKDSLGGNTYTVMIACINPSASSLSQSIQTLHYASDTRKIKNRPIVNVGTPTDQIKQLQIENEMLRGELYKLRSSTPSSANPLFDNKASELIEAAYNQSNALNEQLLLSREMNGVLKETLRKFRDVIKAVVADISAAAATDENLKLQVQKLEEILKETLEIVVKEDVVLNGEAEESYKDNETGYEDENEVFEESGEASDEDQDAHLTTAKKQFDKIVDNQRTCTTKLKSIDYELKLKELMCRELDFIDNHINATDVEDKENKLEIEIKQLTEEKKELIATMEKEKMGSKENEKKLAEYEAQIKKLSKELRDVKKSLQMRTETKAKVLSLQNEIQALKKQRVDVVKKMNEANNEHRRKELSKDRDIARMKKTSKKIELQMTRMAEDYRNKIRVLENRVHKYEQARTAARKMNLLPKHSQANTEEFIEKKLNADVENKLMKIELQEMISEADNLEKHIKSIEELNHSDEPKDSQSSDVYQMKAELKSLLEKIDNMKTKTFEKKTKHCVLLDSLPSLPQDAKTVITALYKKCTMSRVEMKTQQDEYQEKFKKAGEAKQNEIKTCVNEYEKQILELEQKTEHLQNLLNDQQNDNLRQKEAKVFEVIVPTESSSSLPDEASMLTAEKGNPDDTRAFFETLKAELDKKKAEVKQLEKKLGEIKRQEKRKWLTTIPGETEAPEAPLDGSIYQDDSMVQEYLTTDNEESFCNDPNDPDWRATPLYKQSKRRRMDVSESQPKQRNAQLGETFLLTSGSIETMDTSENDFVTPVKLHDPCKCLGDCKTNRCKCRKNELVCTKACQCKTSKCVNVSISKE